MNDDTDQHVQLSRRSAPALLAGAGATLALSCSALAQSSVNTTAAPIFSGPGPLTGWNGLGPLIALPQKVPLIRLVDRLLLYEIPETHAAGGTQEQRHDGAGTLPPKKCWPRSRTTRSACWTARIEPSPRCAL